MKTILIFLIETGENMKNKLFYPLLSLFILTNIYGFDSDLKKDNLNGPVKSIAKYRFSGTVFDSGEITEYDKNGFYLSKSVIKSWNNYEPVYQIRWEYSSDYLKTTKYIYDSKGSVENIEVTIRDDAKDILEQTVYSSEKIIVSSTEYKYEQLKIGVLDERGKLPKRLTDIITYNFIKNEKKISSHKHYKYKPDIDGPAEEYNIQHADIECNREMFMKSAESELGVNLQNHSIEKVNNGSAISNIYIDYDSYELISTYKNERLIKREWYFIQYSNTQNKNLLYTEVFNYDNSGNILNYNLYEKKNTPFFSYKSKYGQNNTLKELTIYDDKINKIIFKEIYNYDKKNKFLGWVKTVYNQSGNIISFYESDSNGKVIRGEIEAFSEKQDFPSRKISINEFGYIYPIIKRHVEYKDSMRIEKEENFRTNDTSIILTEKIYNNRRQLLMLKRFNEKGKCVHIEKYSYDDKIHPKPTKYALYYENGNEIDPLKLDNLEPVLLNIYEFLNNNIKKTYNYSDYKKNKTPNTSYVKTDSWGNNFVWYGERKSEYDIHIFSQYVIIYYK